MEFLQAHQQMLPVSKQNRMSEHSKNIVKSLSIVDFGNTVIFSSRGWEPHLNMIIGKPLFATQVLCISPLPSKATSQRSTIISMYLIACSWAKRCVRMMAHSETSAKILLGEKCLFLCRLGNRIEQGLLKPVNFWSPVPRRREQECSWNTAEEGLWSGE